MEGNKSYASCIKIKGVPILPPLITSDRRKELQEYKNRALLLEQLYCNRRLNKKESENDEQEINLANSESQSETAISCNDQSFNLNQILKEISSPLKYVPYENGKNKVLSLSTDLIDVSEYSSSIPETCKNTHERQELSTSALELDSDQFKLCVSEECKLKLDISSCSTELVIGGNSSDSMGERKDTEKPRLIRSNSYTLDNPSPLLLAHMKRQNSISSSEHTNTDRNDEDIESFRAQLRYSNDEKSNSRNSFNVDQGNITANSMDINDLNLSENSQSNACVQKDLFSQPTVELITTDITVQQINITTTVDDNPEEIDLLQMLSVVENPLVKDGNQNSPNTDPETELQLILQQLPENYSKKILELMERQKIEQQKRVQNYENKKKELLHSGDFQNNNPINSPVPNKIFVTSASNSQRSNNAKNAAENIDTMRRSSISECTNSNISNVQRPRTSSTAEDHSSQFDMSTSCSESLEDFSSRTVKMIDLESEDGLDYLTIYEKMYPMGSRETGREISNKIEQNPILSRSILQDERAIQKSREQKAASIIGAYVRGYLVRRLMKTTKVITLIQTIQDALLCALELQRSETIEEADVELHRRLIQQVSAACYEFHDIFFALTTAEQMDLIAIDREKKRKAIEIRASRSTIDFRQKRRSTSNVRLSKSLTKV